jgi:hypothetical protein
MTSAQFLRAVLLLYGDHWQPALADLLARHGITYTRQSFWNWKRGRTPVPAKVEAILKAEAATAKMKGPNA